MRTVAHLQHRKNCAPQDREAAFRRPVASGFARQDGQNRQTIDTALALFILTLYGLPGAQRVFRHPRHVYCAGVAIPASTAP